MTLDTFRQWFQVQPEWPGSGNTPGRKRKDIIHQLTDHSLCSFLTLSYPETLQTTNTQSICLFPCRQNIYYWWNPNKTKLTKSTYLFPNLGKLVPGPSFWDGTCISEVVWSDMEMSILVTGLWFTLLKFRGLNVVSICCFPLATWLILGSDPHLYELISISCWTQHSLQMA